MVAAIDRITDPSAFLYHLATDLFEATMASLRVQLRLDPERDAICARMPEHLLAIREANRLAQRAEVTARLDLQGAVQKDQWPGEWGQRFAHTRDTAPEDLPALRQSLIEEMKQKHALLAAQARAAQQAEVDIHNEWCAAENRLISEWHEKHIPRLQALIAAFQLEFEQHRHRIPGIVELKEFELGNLAEGASTASQVLLKFADRVVHFRSQSCDGLDPDQLKVAVEREAGWLARNPTQPIPGGAAREEAEGGAVPTPIQFQPVERAIVLLVRDGRNPRSVRDYAKEVGVAHSTLSRNPDWQRAYEAAKAHQAKRPDEMPTGSKDAEGNVEAWREEEVCENCRLEPIAQTATVNGEVVRLCEGCALKLVPRTNPRTT